MKKKWYFCKRFREIIVKKSKIGTLSERLGIGLQNRLEQFDSARYLFFLCL